NVIVELNDQLVISGFADKSGLSEIELLDLVTDSPLVHAYEMGKVESTQFYEDACELLSMEITFQEFSEIWNSTIYHLPISKVQLLERLNQTHKVLILSNTNALHKMALDQLVNMISGRDNFDQLSFKAYYSHEVGLRKPDIKIFETVVNEENLNPQMTLFLDDKLENVKAAEKLGIKGIHVENPDQLLTYFE
ncbi:MAG: HAD-IA family hydrolase, partial [Proteobacteria bacterium]|nr:HAD-IA family hydrolase [Pseudomonadota bacterium]